MNRKNIYLALAIFGLIAPYYFFIQVREFDLQALGEQFAANKLLGGLAVDLLVSVIVFWFFMVTEAKRLNMKNIWVYFLAIFLVGLSFALPLFLYFREQAMERQ